MFSEKISDEVTSFLTNGPFFGGGGDIQEVLEGCVNFLLLVFWECFNIPSTWASMIPQI